MPSQSRWVTGAPPPGPYIPPRHPSFYSKALTVIWGLAPASPQPLAPQRPGIDRATGHGQGPGLGGPCCQRPGHPHPNALSHMQCLAWDPVNRRPAKPRPFPIKAQGEGCPCSPPPAAGPSPLTPLLCDTDPVFSSSFSFFFFFLKGSFLRRQLSSFLQDTFRVPPRARQPPKCLRTPPPEGGGRGAQGWVASLTPQCHGVSSFGEPSVEAKQRARVPRPGTPPTPPQLRGSLREQPPPPYTPLQ